MPGPVAMTVTRKRVAWLAGGCAPLLGATSTVTTTSGRMPASSAASSALSTASLTQVRSAFRGLSKPSRWRFLVKNSETEMSRWRAPISAADRAAFGSAVGVLASTVDISFFDTKPVLARDLLLAPDLRSGEEMRDEDARSRRRQRGDPGGGVEHLAAGVAPPERRCGIGGRLPVHLEDAVHQVEHPVVLQAGPSVETALPLPIHPQARLGRLHGEEPTRGVRAAVVFRAPGDDRDVRLGLGVVVEPDGSLRARVPPGPERRFQRPRGLHDRRVVRDALWLGDHELATDELDGLARLEHAPVDEPLVLGPAEAAGLGLVTRHRTHGIGGPGAGQRRGMDTASARARRRSPLTLMMRTSAATAPSPR